MKKQQPVPGSPPPMDNESPCCAWYGAAWADPRPSGARAATKGALLQPGLPGKHLGSHKPECVSKKKERLRTKNWPPRKSNQAPREVPAHLGRGGQVALHCARAKSRRMPEKEGVGVVATHTSSEKSARASSDSNEGTNLKWPWIRDNDNDNDSMLSDMLCLEPPPINRFCHCNCLRNNTSLPDSTRPS